MRKHYFDCQRNGHDVSSTPTSVTIIVTLTPEQAAGIKRFAEKVSHSDAMAVLYAHVPQSLRSDQAFQIMQAFGVIDHALTDVAVHSWPWIETGKPR